MTTANTKDVFRWAIGKTIAGMYREHSENAGEIVVLVLSDGSGLAFGTGNGSHWTYSADDVMRRVRQRRAELQNVERELRDAMVLEGALRCEP
jgi:hypothetical protein